jgi:hypothetical protein
LSPGPRATAARSGLTPEVIDPTPYKDVVLQYLTLAHEKI